MEYFKLLGVSENASDEEIKKAYYKLASKYHPDHLSKEEAKKYLSHFLKITRAYRALIEPQKRRAYIRQCKLGIFEEDKEKDRRKSRKKIFEKGTKILLQDPIRSSKYLRRAYSLERNNQTYKSYYGLSLALCGREKKGLKLCIEALEKEENSEHHFNVAKCYAKLKKYRKALQHSKKALRFNKNKNQTKIRKFIQNLKTQTGIKQLFNRG